MSQKQIDIKDTTEVKCEKCSGLVFSQGIVLRKVSALLTDTGRAGYVPAAQPFYCVSCGHVNDEFLPEQLKIKSAIVV